ncbi:MAG TPA: Ig-like domain-containing protein [Gemmatimonadaceae bacterium]
MRRLTAALVLALGACAQLGAPPGGPPRHVAPKIVSITPDTFATNVKAKEVDIVFDEVLAEKPASQTATTLSGLALISPSDGPPNVGWHRERLSIKGKHDFLPNTAYTVTMLPGIADLHGNILKTPITIVFSTGDSIPNTRITGVAFDWVTAKPIPNAMVEAVQRRDSTDSTVYLARGDSLGAFVLAHAPAATYTLRVWNDANNNRLIDPHEVWDSAHVVLRDSTRLEMLAFAHDTVAPRIDQFAIMDSTDVRITFDRALDTAQKLDTSMFILKRADSSVLALRGVERAALFDSTRAANAPKDTSRADSIKKAAAAAAAAPTRGRRDLLGGRAGPDTTKRPPLPKPSRPSPVIEVVVELAEPLTPGTSYRITARDVRNLLGFKASPTRVFTMPKPTPPSTKPEAHPPAKAKADTTKPPPTRTP